MICWKRAFILFFGFIFSLNTFASENADITLCTSEHNSLLYFQQTQQLMKQKEPSPELLYDTAVTAMCIGKFKIAANMLSDILEQYIPEYPKEINPKQISSEDRQRALEMLQSLSSDKQLSPEQNQRASEILQSVRADRQSFSPGFFTRDKAFLVIPVIKEEPNFDNYGRDNFNLAVEAFILLNDGRDSVSVEGIIPLEN